MVRTWAGQCRARAISRTSSTSGMCWDSFESPDEMSSWSGPPPAASGPPPPAGTRVCTGPADRTAREPGARLPSPGRRSSAGTGGGDATSTAASGSRYLGGGALDVGARGLWAPSLPRPCLGAVFSPAGAPLYHVVAFRTVSRPGSGKPVASREVRPRDTAASWLGPLPGGIRTSIAPLNTLQTGRIAGPGP